MQDAGWKSLVEEQRPIQSFSGSHFSLDLFWLNHLYRISIRERLQIKETGSTNTTTPRRSCTLDTMRGPRVNVSIMERSVGNHWSIDLLWASLALMLAAWILMRSNHNRNLSALTLGTQRGLQAVLHSMGSAWSVKNAHAVFNPSHLTRKPMSTPNR